MRNLVLPAILTILPLVATAQSPRVTSPTGFGKPLMAAPVRVGTVPRKAAPNIGAARAIVIDYGSGRVLYEKNASKRCAVASTQKLLMALILCEAGNMSKSVRVASSDTWVEPAKMGIRAGQDVPVTTRNIDPTVRQPHHTR